MANKCVGTNFQGKRRRKKLQYLQWSKAVRAAMKIIERVLERRIQELVNIDSMQFGFMSGRRTTDTLFVV